MLYGSVLSQGASELIQHDLLAFADLDRAEAHESAFLRSVGSRLRRHDEPTAEGLGFIRCCLLGDDPGDSTKFVEDLGAGRCCARWLEVLRRVLLRSIIAWMSRATAASSSSWLGERWQHGASPSSPSRSR